MQFKIAITTFCLAIMPSVIAVPGLLPLDSVCTSDSQRLSKNCCGFIPTHKNCLPQGTVC
ncbi:hypothetical protein HYPSUDRAFT_49009 [Hypholoma sublateritium FD-334 SS-4]|uniref:Uncharacterized protein n=1 Tax=Hypholoma sublateritium (strain FD-334 SS-4) TaxID=945553 RepID=A0A0D2P1Z0_HYPSF|nr:hypothetical protein HYPSUDRAFT_49009 [Hypholoma sublateritium FD-334 SS-4]